MTKDEALKLALEWAEARGEIVFAGGGMDAVNKMNSWVTAIKKALAQPEQEPVKIIQYNCKCGRTMKFESVHGVVAPQRSESSGKPAAWVGLTDKQTTQAIKSMPKGIKGWMIDWDLHDFSKAIEAKLKEKNT